MKSAAAHLVNFNQYKVIIFQEEYYLYLTVYSELGSRLDTLISPSSS